MLILGIESSCDETAAAVVEDGSIVHSSIIATQLERHKVFGGVIPEIAAREHLNAISPVVEQSLHAAGIGFDELDAIAVTQGPGLIGALLVGVHYAKGLALSINKPLVAVNHVHAHIHGALLGQSAKVLENLFPCLAAVVSGGHTILYYMTGPTEFKLLGSTIDDACGESFDKVAKLLGLGYPGGPAVEQVAKSGDIKVFPMPKSMSSSTNLDMSYSGIKTHVANRVHQKENWSEQEIADLCAAFQEAALDQLLRKMEIACRQYPQVKSLVIAGGVSANQHFRAMLESRFSDKQRLLPELTYCSDNAAMIAALGYYEFCESSPEVLLQHEWEAYAQYPFQKYR